MARRRSTATPAPVEVPRTERRIQFFRIRAGTLASGQPFVYSAQAAMERIETLPFVRGGTGRYLAEPDGDDVCCWVDQATSPQKLRLGIVRRSNFPQVELGGDLSPLGIARAAGLAEYTHMMFLGNNILGAEFNFYGPRPGRLATYINIRADVAPRISINPLLRDDVIPKLEAMQEIKLFDMKVRRSYLDEVKQADQSLGDALEVTAEVGDATEIELILRPKKRSQNSLSDRLIDILKTLAGNRPRMMEEASRLKAKGVFEGSGGRVEELDLLSDAFVMNKQIVLLDEKSRALNADSAYAAIESAYRELLPQLLVASDTENG